MDGTKVRGQVLRELRASATLAVKAQMNRSIDRAYQLGFCGDCGVKLSLTEDHYYEIRCEECERKWHERIQAWKQGAKDEGLDFLFGGGK